MVDQATTDRVATFAIDTSHNCIQVLNALGLPEEDRGRNKFLMNVVRFRNNDNWLRMNVY